MPLEEPLVTIEAVGETHPGIPQLARGHFVLPVRNVGDLDVVHLHATVRATGRVAEAELRGLAPGEVAVLTFGTWDDLPSFTLRLQATAADGSQAIRCAQFDADLDRYL
ncbi:MAG: hypothetical protein ACYCXW_15505 [Solirubrobacteraceae bacterium]